MPQMADFLAPATGDATSRATKSVRVTGSVDAAWTVGYRSFRWDFRGP